ncbi:hypothetical protein CEP52_011127 [Fusarium oligoseptatum]|uniref:non-specific serine/threonine protein kinase n=1 Tax=Fusarium oligoseptatum TaxID=2604345 RepID=A0A428T4P8_9HYPO|nr:hypothetical protein CEP52_011127 [Fusarium oligoseptatum]
MEYCELGDLKDHVEMYGKLPEDQVQDIGCQVLQGLRFMHQNNFAHRDLKPANILIKDKPPHGDWYVKICDFGLSKRIGADIATTTVKGTPGFMPPELIPGIGDDPKHVDHFPADMWCFGETIFYLLTHERAFGGDLRLLKYWKGGPFPKEPLLRVSASDAAVSFVQELMVTVPAKRLTAEMAAQHVFMKTEPLQKAGREMGETSSIKEDLPSPPADEQASGRWTTLASLQQGVEPPTGLTSTTTATALPRTRPDQVPSRPPRTPRETEDILAKSRRLRDVRMPDTREEDIRTEKTRKVDSRRTSEHQSRHRAAPQEHRHYPYRPRSTRQARPQYQAAIDEKPKKEKSAKLNIRDWLRNIGSSKRLQTRPASPAHSSRYSDSYYSYTDISDSGATSDAASPEMPRKNVEIGLGSNTHPREPDLLMMESRERKG